MTTELKKVLIKIKKCLALSQSPEPEEAAAALRQAQKLMEKYNVSQADVGLAEIRDVEVKSVASVSRMKVWELHLLNIVAKAFGCEVLWRGARSYDQDNFGRYVLIGIESQVQLAQYTAEVMQRKLMAARLRYVSQLPIYFRRATKTVEADGFCHGWVTAISKTVHEFAMSDETRTTIRKYAENLTDGREAKVHRRKLGSEGFYAGIEKGHGETIQRPVTGGSPLMLK